MELRQLEYFEAVSRLRSFTKAASELCVAQPSITVAIRKLEEELGIPLFERSRKKISLTLEGEIFLQKANRILGEIQDTFKVMNDLRPDLKRILRLGIPPSLGSWMFPLIYSDYAGKYPTVKLMVHEMGTHEIIQQLLDEKIELGFIVMYKPMPMFELLPVSEGELLLLLPSDHPLKQYARVPFELLINERFIMYYEGTYIYSKVMEECNRHQFKPDVLCTPSQIATLFNLVANGSGISFILDDAVAILKDNPCFVTRPLTDAINFKTGIIWKNDKYLSKAAREFIEFMKKAE
ncbi:LysR family transcriptional regulator [Desulfosporosinus sp. BICA1-9]|uniref:LysR family transcriptional regulator n=1 Tax=Desulfosporosinus sp. BICA1-9 TaxID=1531958 RepID=UPI00054C5290|nr:LysR family transcriptional regulator [Desulfosporosinus sp. BICA1-9]KJS47887.1 MAG: hypothetical protein VR66_17145 [Peptococcaceae bacterium BRH_c23]KJS81639.1 MAG: hypothetical protein JL57_26250 [Desulfosporosinus sp. BICA1-9]HBW35559.1 LysR family transcriptional regulator [Desulfosporosinus sp.]